MKVNFGPAQNLRDKAVMVFCLGLLLAGCGSGQPAITDCQPLDGAQPICIFQNPEDLELLPDGKTLMVSQFGGMEGERPGSLALFDTTTLALQVLPPAQPNLADYWGDAGCVTPPDSLFSPHGIHLSRRAGGEQQLLVVNHGGRESIEFFEVSAGDDSYSLQWRGCVVAPAGVNFNDVVALPGGGFLATHTFSRDGPMIAGLHLDLWLAMLGKNTGYVVHWDGHSIATQAGTEAPFPNGIQISPDGRTIYLNVYMSNEVRKIDRLSGATLARAAVQGPDNIQWDARGKLLVASQNGATVDKLACFEIQDSGNGACPAAFAVIELDPDSMHTRELFSHSGPPMGAATVVQQVGEALWLGTFAGDRLLKVPLTELQ